MSQSEKRHKLGLGHQVCLILEFMHKWPELSLQRWAGPKAQKRYGLTGEMGLDLQGSGETREHPECLAGWLAPRAAQDKLDPIGGESGAAPSPTQRPLRQVQP